MVANDANDEDRDADDDEDDAGTDATGLSTLYGTGLSTLCSFSAESQQFFHRSSP